MTKQEVKNLEVKYEVVKSEMQLARQFITHEGFYRYWFEQLAAPENRELNKYQVFEKVNKLYQRIFDLDKGKYSSYNSFQSTVNRLRNNR